MDLNKKYQIYTLAELAQRYQISKRTLQYYIDPIKEELLSMYPIPKKRLRILLPKQVRRIMEWLDGVS